MDQNTIGRERFQELLLRRGAREKWSQVVDGKLYAIVEVLICKHLHNHDSLCGRHVALVGDDLGAELHEIQPPIVTDGISVAYAAQAVHPGVVGFVPRWQVVDRSTMANRPTFAAIRGLAMWRGLPLFVGVTVNGRTNRAHLYYDDRCVWEAPCDQVSGIVIWKDEAIIHWEPCRTHGRVPAFEISDLERFLGLRSPPPKVGPYR